MSQEPITDRYDDPPANTLDELVDGTSENAESGDQLDAEVRIAADNGEKRRFQIPMWFALTAMLIALVFAGLIISRVARPLYTLVFPFKPLAPSGSEEIDHDEPDKGPEYWIFRTDRSAAEVAEYYESEGGRCTTTNTTGVPKQQQEQLQTTTYCKGQKENVVMDIYWEVYIREGYSESEGPTVFRFYKDYSPFFYFELEPGELDDTPASPPATD
ncbi:MAG: hypothetical protein GYB65_11605 [Chloroflexi bacterium]|nr:hypothetical protein [Chloroflexota bacterium]